MPAVPGVPCLEKWNCFKQWPSYLTRNPRRTQPAGPPPPTSKRHCLSVLREQRAPEAERQAGARRPQRGGEAEAATTPWRRAGRPVCPPGEEGRRGEALPGPPPPRSNRRACGANYAAASSGPSPQPRRRRGPRRAACREMESSRAPTALCCAGRRHRTTDTTMHRAAEPDVFGARAATGSSRQARRRMRRGALGSVVYWRRAA